MEDTNNENEFKRGRGRPPKTGVAPIGLATKRRRLPEFNLRKVLNKRFIFTLLLLILILAPTLYFYDKQQDTKKRLDALQAQQDETPAGLVKKVSAHVLLPEGEEPTIATVTDPAQLSNQLFFARAVKDDKVLVYNQAKRAILYRPSIDKVIEAAPLTDTQPTTGQ